MVFQANDYPSVFIHRVSIHCAHLQQSPEKEKPVTSVCIPYIRGTSECILAKQNIRTSFHTFVSLHSLLFFSVLAVNFPEEGLCEESETLEYQVFTTLILTISHNTVVLCI